MKKYPANANDTILMANSWYLRRRDLLSTFVAGCARKRDNSMHVNTMYNSDVNMNVIKHFSWIAVKSNKYFKVLYYTTHLLLISKGNN